MLSVGIFITAFDEFLGKKRIKCRPINNSLTRSRLNIWIPSRDQNVQIYFFVILIIVFTFFAIILYKK